MQTQTSTRRLVRRTDDRVIAGVASGLADVLGVDPVLVRVGFVVLAFAGGAGVIAYLALWLLAPEGSGSAPVDVSRDRGAAFWVAIGLFVLAGLAIADSVADRSVVWPLVLVGVGIALWRSDGRRAAPAAPSMPTTWPDATRSEATSAPTAAAPAPTGAPTGSGTAGGAPATAPVAPSTAPTWTPPPPPGGGGSAPGEPPAGGGNGPRASGRERSVLGRITIGMALLALGVLALLDQADVLTLTFTDAVAVTLLVLGLGLVVGTWVGRARWLAIPAVLLLLPALLVSATTAQLGLDLRDGIGDASVGTTSVEAVRDSYRHGVGEMTVRLGELDLDGRTIATEATIGIGHLVVVVPDEVTVEVGYDVTAGELDLFGESINGQSLQGREVVAGEPGAGTLQLDVGVGLGQVEIQRWSDRGGVSGRVGAPALPSRSVPAAIPAAA